MRPVSEILPVLPDTQTSPVWRQQLRHGQKSQIEFPNENTDVQCERLSEALDVYVCDCMHCTIAKLLNVWTSVPFKVARECI